MVCIRKCPSRPPRDSLIPNPAGTVAAVVAAVADAVADAVDVAAVAVDAGVAADVGVAAEAGGDCQNFRHRFAGSPHCT